MLWAEYLKWGWTIYVYGCGIVVLLTMHLLRKRDEFFKRPFRLELGIHMAKVYVESHDRFGERNSHSVAPAFSLKATIT